MTIVGGAAYIGGERKKEQPINYSTLTDTKLKALCAERGIAIPPKAKKSDIIALLIG